VVDRAPEEQEPVVGAEDMNVADAAVLWVPGQGGARDEGEVRGAAVLVALFGGRAAQAEGDEVGPDIEDVIDEELGSVLRGGAAEEAVDPW